MYRFALLAMLVSCYAPNVANAQVVFKGPTEAKPNKMTTIALEKVEGDDLKVQGFLNGKPAGVDWLLMKDLENKLFIFLLTDKEGVFTFVAGVNKAGKTHITNHVITVGSPSPTPPEPKPQPENDFAAKLKTAYRVSPDAPSLAKLITILEQVTSQNYRNYEDMESILVATGARYLPNNELRKVRDLITDEIVARCGTNNANTDVAKVKTVLNDAITALKETTP